MAGVTRGDRIGWLYGILVVAILVSPLVEYGSIVWRRFEDLDFVSYQLSDAEFAAAGNLRFLRDGLVLAGALGGLLVSGIDRRGFLQFLAWEMLLIGIGTIGHVPLPRPALYVAGLRWVLNLQFAAILILVLAGCSERFWRRFKIGFGLALGGIMAILLAGLLYEWIALDFAVGLRLTSFLPQAEMVIELAQGLAFFTIAVGGGGLAEALALVQLAAVGVLTATRMAPVFAMLLLARWPIRWIAKTARRHDPAALVFLSLVVFAAMGAASIPVASLMAQRGPVLRQQFESARLADWPREFHLIERQTPLTLLFGKGLGYRTTTAGTLHLGDIYHDPYIEGHENAVAALFAQLGVAGLVVIASGAALLLRALLRVAGEDPAALARIAALLAVIFVLSMAGYWYEWPLFVQPVAAGLAWMLRRPATAPQHEHRLLGQPVGEVAGGGQVGVVAGAVQ